MLGNCQSQIDSLLASVLENIILKSRGMLFTLNVARLRNLGIAFSFSLIKNVCQRVSSLLEQIF